jgi:DNA repair protein RadA/Sms
MLQAAGSVASLSKPPPGIGMGPREDTSSDYGPVWYVSGEESPDQIASRAERLGIAESQLFLLRETHVDTLCEQIVAQHMTVPKKYSTRNNEDDDDGETNNTTPRQPLSLVVIDSIQTMVCDAGGVSAAGGVTQVRECVAMFLRLSKSTGIPVVLIGHVTRSGDLAGPKTVEHMVDCVLYLEGLIESSFLNLRMLRASKNRFGSSDEVGVYEMTKGRLLPVSDPSSLFLAHRNDQEDAEGCAIAMYVLRKFLISMCFLIHLTIKSYHILSLVRWKGCEP